MTEHNKISKIVTKIKIKTEYTMMKTNQNTNETIISVILNQHRFINELIKIICMT